MKLTSKILSVLLAAVVLTTTVAGYLTVRSAYVDLERRQQELAQRLADEMQERLVSAWQSDGMRGIARTLEDRVLASDEPLALRWVWFDPDATPKERPRADVLNWRDIRLGQILSVVKEEPSGDRLLLTYMPIRVVGGNTGGLELAQPLAALEQQTRQVVFGSLLIIGASALLGLGMAYLAGIRWVAKPLKQLIEKTQRIGQGDFTQPLKLASGDELDELARALNAMCEKLSTQQSTIAVEMAERLKTLQQLRHADRLSTLGRMAAGIAHELGTPLNVVAGRAALISSGKLDSAEIETSAKTIKAEADRITAIVQRLLDFARQRRPQRSRCEVWALAERTLKLLSPMADKKRVVLEILPPTGDTIASIDEAQIQQVLTNLIVNAVQASPAAGRVEVNVTPAESSSTSSKVVRIRVTDSGPGVPEELRERIFEPFFTTKDVGEGTGLGLSIAYGIVQEHGGLIEVAKGPTGGASFEVLLPCEATVTHALSSTNLALN